MSIAQFRCPACQATLRTAAPLSAGRLIRCPKCGGTFPAEEMADYPAPMPAPASADPYPAQPGYEPGPGLEPPLDQLPRYQPRRKPASSSAGWIAAAVVLAVLVAGGVLLYLYWPHRRTEPLPANEMAALKHVPANTEILLGIDAESLLENEEVEKFINSAPAMGKKSNAEEMKDLDHVVFALPPGQLQRLLMGTPEFTIVGKSRKSLSQKEELRSVNAEGQPRQFQGKDYYLCGPQGPGKLPVRLIFFPDDSTVVSSNLPDDRIGDVLSLDGSRTVLSKDLMDMLTQVGKTQVWVVFKTEAATNLLQLGRLGGLNVDEPLELLQLGRAGGIWLNTDKNNITLSIGLVCRNADDAAKAAEKAKALWPRLKARMLAGLNPVPPDIQQHLKDLLESVEVTHRGELVLLSGRTSISLLQSLSARGGQ